ncbi:MAG: hypothetical protein HY245_03975 [Rhizobiales bacterium]|nr:hypothetical protein [Hyphomicrobiales bacterium]
MIASQPSLIAQLTADWWTSLAQFKADILAAKGNEKAIEEACAAEQARAELLLKAIEGAGRMTPTEAAGLLDLVLVLFADDGREDDQVYRLLSAISDSMAPPS